MNIECPFPPPTSLTTVSSYTLPTRSVQTTFGGTLSADALVLTTEKRAPSLHRAACAAFRSRRDGDHCPLSNDFPRSPPSHVHIRSFAPCARETVARAGLDVRASAAEMGWSVGGVGQKLDAGVLREGAHGGNGSRSVTRTRNVRVEPALRRGGMCSSILPRAFHERIELAASSARRRTSLLDLDADRCSGHDAGVAGPASPSLGALSGAGAPSSVDALERTRSFNPRTGRRRARTHIAQGGDDRGERAELYRLLPTGAAPSSFVTDGVVTGTGECGRRTKPRVAPSSNQR